MTIRFVSRYAFVFAVAFSFLLSTGGNEVAAEGFWKLPNPFAKKEKKERRTEVQDRDEKQTEGPGVPRDAGEVVKTVTNPLKNLIPAPAPPSTAPVTTFTRSAHESISDSTKKFSLGTRSFFAKTGDFLNPFNDGDDKKPEAATRRHSPAPQTPGTRRRLMISEDKDGKVSFASWLGLKKEDE